MITRNLMKKMLIRLLVGGIMFAAVVLPHAVVADSDADYPEYAAYDGEWVDLNDNLLSEMSVSRLLDGVKWGLGKIELTEGYQSPIGADEREMMIKSVTARHGKFWIPRKLSTAIGRLEETLKYAKGITDAWTIGKIIGITAGAKSFDDAVDTFAEEGVFQGSALGEAGYWASTIIFGMTHGKSFVDAIIDGYDEKNIGLWSKLGVTFGGWVADGVIMLTEDKDAKAAADKAFRDYLIAQGINSDGLAVVDAWLSLSSENRVKTPLLYDSSWFEHTGAIMSQDDWLRISYRQNDKEYQDKPFDATFSLGADITIDLSKKGYLEIGNLKVGYALCGMSDFSGTIKGNGHKIFVTGKSLVHDGEGSFLIFKATGAKFENVTFCGRGIQEAEACEFYGCGIENFAIVQKASNSRFEKCGGTANMSPLKYGETVFIGRGAIACEAKNCEFRDCWVEGQVGGDHDSGAIAGQAEGCSFVNCLSTAEVVSTDAAGGLVGWAEGCEFSNCAATGNVSGHSEVGGFVGYSTESLFSKCQARGKVIGGKTVGGFAGDIRGKSMVECFASGDVYCEDSLTGAPAEIGGFAGHIIKGAIVEECAAIGAVYASGATEVGGFVGSVNGEVSIQRCYASGHAVGGSFVGGFSGSLSECKIYNCYATGGSEAKGYSMGGGMVTSASAYAGGFSGQAMSEGGADCRYCYATGKVSATGGDAMTTIAGGFTPLSVPDSMAESMGGYLSMLQSASVECYWDVSATGCKYSGMGTGLRGTAMTTATSFSKWDASIWVFNGGYPYIANLGKTGEIPDIEIQTLPDPIQPSIPSSPDPEPTLPPTPNPEPTPTPELGSGDYSVGGDDVEGVIPETAASVYDGYMYRDNEVYGTIQAKVSKPKMDKKLGKATAKVAVSIQILGEKKVTVKDELDVESGNLEAEAKDGRKLSLEFGLYGMAGAFGEYDIEGVRNLFSSKDKAEKAGAEDALEDWLGALNMKCGNGVLSVTVAKKGKVTIKGTYNGDKVSAKAQALIGEDMICIPVVYSKKSVNLAFTVWLPIGGTEAKVVGFEKAAIGKAGTLKAGAVFNIDEDILVDIETEDKETLELLPIEESVSVSGKKWIVANGAKAAKVAYKKGEGLSITPGKKGEESANPSGLKITYKDKDGSFKGSFTAYAIVKGKLKKHKATVEGVVINGVGYGTATIKKLGSWAITIE